MMRGRTLEERVRRLEAEIEGHQKEIERLRLGLASDGEQRVPGALGPATGALGLEDTPVHPEKIVGPAGEPASGRGWPEIRLPRGLADMRRWEWWMNKVGIALFLMGVVFLLKFSWDRGWLQVLLTPEVRVGLGLLLGSALVWVGLRVYAERRAFAQVVLGGGISTYYITGFAAYGMLGVLSYPVAFVFMVAVTLLAFALALRQQGAVLAVIGTSGGLATPFLLYDGEGSVPGLVLYLCVVLAGALGVYLYKGWPSLLLVASAGYWAALLMGYSGAAWVGTVPVSDLAAVQAGVVLGWASLWLVSAAREALRLGQPGRWGVREPGPFVRVLIGKNGTLAHLLSFALPVIGLGFTQLLWDPGRTTMGVAAVGVAVLHGLAWAGFRRVAGGGRVAYTQAVVALLISTLAMALLLEGAALLLVLAAEAAALHLLARRLSDDKLAAIAHGLFLFVGAWLLGRITGLVPYRAASDAAVVGTGALTDLVVLALILAASWSVRSRVGVTAYRVAAHAALLAWYGRELALLPGASDAYVTLAWGLTGAGMFVAGLRLDHLYLIRGGVATLFVVVAKLLLWDLTGLDPAWRILLFLGFGALLLLLGYHLRNLWNPKDMGESGSSRPPFPEDGATDIESSSLKHGA